MKNTLKKVALAAVVSLAVGMIVFHISLGKKTGNGYKTVASDNSLRAHLLGNKDYRNFEIGLEEYTVSSIASGYEVELRDRRICHDSTKDDDACTAIVWRMGPNGKFVSREEYHFQNGRKVWIGRIDQVGQKDDYRQVASYGVGNPLPYVFQTYPDNPKDRRIYFFQEQINNILKEIPPAA